MKRFSLVFGVFIAIAALLAQGCEAPPTASNSGGEGLRKGLPASRSATTPKFDPATFVHVIDNPYLPLSPGTAFHYRSETPDGVETSDFLVTHDTKKILGVNATVVHDQVFLEGELTEDTFDWFAQDTQGNVWYLGEDSKEIENGHVVSTEGSWEAGVEGAVAGIVMLAHPRPGVSYRQELAPGVAEDMARVLGLNASPSAPYGKFDHCLQTMEWTPLQLGLREHKFYCRSVGLVLTVQPKGGNIRDELVGITHF